MAELSARLVEALEDSCELDLLLFVPILAGDLLQTVPSERVKELSLLLLCALKDPAQLQIIKYLQAYSSQQKGKLVLLLNRSERLTMNAIEQLILPCFEKLVRVTEAFLWSLKPQFGDSKSPCA